MQKLFKTGWLAALATMLLTSLAVAGDEVPKERYLMWWDNVNPAMAADYEVAIKDMIQTYSQSEITNLSWGAVQDEERYGYLIPIGEKYAGLDTWIENWGAATEKIGKDKMDAMNKRTAKAIYHHSAEFLKLRPDLSYAPAGDFKAGDAGFRNIEAYYAIPGQEDDMEEIAKAWIELYKKHDVKHGFYIYQQTVGPDLPVYLVVQRATSAAAFHKASEELYKKTQAEIDALMAKTLRVTRKRLAYDATTRPDLAYPPPENRMAKN